jgi:hemoglobin-like flavoprotein
MTPEQIALVERTLAAVAPMMDMVAADFYRRLFAADPTLVGLFKNDPAVQRAKFAAELQEIMASIRRHEAFLARARALGARHAGYGVRATHYRAVGAALLEALGAALGEAWTAEVEQAWRLAYNLTAESMMAGAADTVPAR